MTRFKLKWLTVCSAAWLYGKFAKEISGQDHGHTKLRQRRFINSLNTEKAQKVVNVWNKRFFNTHGVHIVLQ